MYRKVARSRLSRLVAHVRVFRPFMNEKFDAYQKTVTFGQNSSKLNSRPVYCSRVYGKSTDNDFTFWFDFRSDAKIKRDQYNKDLW